MSNGIDIQTVEFVVEAKSTAGSFRLKWPTDRYYGLLRNPVQVLQMDASELATLARAQAPNFPDVARLARLLHWFESAAQGSRTDWPEVPVLSRRGTGLVFVDGRHRCEALLFLEVARIPVIVG